MRRLLILSVAPMMVLFFVGLAHAPVDPIPHLINYQGVLTNDEGTPLDGNYYLTFKIYDQLAGGAALWTEIHSPVSVENGLFSVTLGNGTSWSTGIPSDVFDGPERYLGTNVGTDPGELELSPRARLTSVGYAYLAETAVTAGSDGDWTISGDDMYSTLSGNVGIGTTSPSYALDVVGDISVSGNIKKDGTNYTHPDYVFEDDYKLMSLEELKNYVKKNKCMPNVISAEDVKKNNGYNLDELLIQMLEKIEEQTLYIFQLEERIADIERGK